ncbi:MAG: tRNA (adenosine(37)-N6)-threonylcarbamoyltransferase complex dimerization subunit type 1 TsaB [Proteobacteria bacterium]|nr:tRNA (adenosine(37)-N6)-threonylcarbamoyltransferase complex dimerization subunit type 1 TsaB [Pseudomonadota bacterium]
MVILAADTSTGFGSVAIRGPGGDILLVSMEGEKPHSETLLPSIDKALSLAGLTRREVRALAAGTGPGNFTGLRVGLSTFKGWALALGLPILPVPSHAAAAYFSLGEGKEVLVLTDARKGEVFASRFRGLDENGIPSKQGETVLLPLEEAVSWASSSPSGPAKILGTAVPLLMEREGAGWIGENDLSPLDPLAPGVLCIGEILLSLGRSVGPESLVPEYVRPPDARPPGSSGIMTP